MARTLAVVTNEILPDLDEDGRALVAALSARGVDARPAIWGDAAVDWAAFDGAVVRTTWDYTDDREGFVAWAYRVASTTRLANPADVLEQNTDKHYLVELARAGAPVVPSVVLEPGDDPSAAALARALGRPDELVVKPTVSAGSRDTGRYRVADEAGALEGHIARLLAAGRSVLAQPYLADIERRGETALIYLGDVFHHAVRKSALLGPSGALVDLDRHEVTEPSEATAAERAVGEVVLDAFGKRERLTYGRVDLVPGPGGEPLLLELELCEPDLFLRHDPASVERFADVLDVWLAGRAGRAGS